ncbi:phenylacetate-CoA oxygenase subunit PaaJ [Neobacillus piezotolerans]|uniref:Phenylacetate-CoA oxygenase subunit PaaJ n=1 Tax=Neobacillus piezotolerans TaxID=2259171 RepID=A0A3D8GMT6_9BACI|nr:1,2-phenylacetyl-CoA epoxidase subunit PaaD [Neobacillus piezotolerans]RDU35790.1 phenylacetate-CoA oxygenase subunit PaaJ [Neobacillus piezotolerans]
MTAVDANKPQDSVLKETILKALHSVMDPEIPTVSIIDLGMLHDVQISGSKVQISLIPTFLGCPALDIIRANTEKSLEEISCLTEIDVHFVYSEIWTTDRITESGRISLKEFGIAPPPRQLEAGGWEVDCPFCGSPYTTLDNIFGPTACRSILYCRSCKNPFEAMKPVSTLM